MSGWTLTSRRWGNGDPVVFLHGLGASSRYWDRLAGLGGSYSGTAPDLLGFGRSPKPPNAAYDVDTHLEALTLLFDGPGFVVAHSTGAILAAALAARRPDLVTGLLLLGLPAYPNQATARHEVGNLGLLARLTADGRPVAALVCKAMCRVRPLATALAPLVARDVPRAIAADWAQHTWPSYSRTLIAVVLGRRVVPDLAAARCPVIALTGRSDTTAPARHLEAAAASLASRNPPVEVRVVDGDHHLAIRRAPLVHAVLEQARR